MNLLVDIVSWKVKGSSLLFAIKFYQRGYFNDEGGNSK